MSDDEFTCIYNKSDFFLLADTKKIIKNLHIDISEDEHEKINFPENINNLYVDKYKYALDNLPENLISLNIRGVRYSHPVNSLSYNLKILELSDYHQKLYNLPSNLEILSINFFLDIMYMHTLDNLPENLQELKLFNYYQSLEKLPLKLKKLKLMNYRKINTPNLNNLPLNLESLTLSLLEINNDLDYLPEGLKYLDLDIDKFNRPIENLPNNLEVLKITYVQNSCVNEIRHLPDNIKKIILCIKMDEIYMDFNKLGKLDNIVNVIPKNLKEIELRFSLRKINNNTNQKINNYIKIIKDLDLDINIFVNEKKLKK